LGRQAIDPTGGLRMQVPPAVESQVCIPAPVQIPNVGLLVACRCVGSALQGGWLLVVRSDRGRQKCPVRAASCRHVLPHGVGLPYRRVLCMRRHPRSLPRVVPITRRLRVPGMGAPAAPRFQHCSVSGSPLPCLRCCRPDGCGVLPPGAAGASQVLVRLSSCMPRPEDSGGPAHPGPHGCSCVAFGVRSNPRRPQHAPFRSCTSPAGCAVTPAAYRIRCRRVAPLVRRVSTAPPWAQDSRRVGGEP
jgi:hypothetical protein